MSDRPPRAPGATAPRATPSRPTRASRGERRLRDLTRCAVPERPVALVRVVEPCARRERAEPRDRAA